MEVQNRLNPNAAQLQAFADPSAEGPIYMVNLLKFRERAEYPDGRDSDLSGAAAYLIYGEKVAELLARYGGAMVFGAQVERLTIGEVEELWDMVAIAMYPSRAAMLQMVQDPDYAEIGMHREAGLVGQLNIETTAMMGALAAQNSPA